MAIQIDRPTPLPARPPANVARGVLNLVLSRFLTIPLSLVVNAVLARRLGAADFGTIYFANAGLMVAFLFVDSGSMAQTAAMVARDPALASRALGTGMALRLGFGAVVLILLPFLTRRLDYSEPVRMVFLLVAVRMLVNSLATVASAVVRGLERVTIHARVTVVTALVDAAVLIPALLLGGALRAALLAQVASAVLALVAWFVVLVRIGAARITFDRSTGIALLRGGFAFLALDLALRIQPWIDANYLEKLSTPQTVGWFAAANRVMGALLIPATLLNFALYPTMSRLWTADRPSFERLTRLGLRMVILFGAMAAVGAVFFADLVVAIIYGKEKFAPAARDLQLLSAYVGLLYLSMLLGCAVTAAGRQLRWAGIQALCIPASLLADPILIPWFQRQSGNGGLGVCLNLIGTEALVLTGALILLPSGVLERSLLRDLARALAGGIAMACCAFLLRATPALGIPLSVAAYLGVQALLGGLDPELLAQLRGTVEQKLSLQPAAR